MITLRRKNVRLTFGIDSYFSMATSLNAWRTRSPKPESHYKCDTCKYAFSFRRTSFARYLGHPLTVFVLTIVAFVLLVFAAGFAMKLLLYLMMDESQEFIYPADL